MTYNPPQSGIHHDSFRVDLDGVIKLLSKNMYSSPGVYIRELIQNAVDATTARQSREPGTITISPYGVMSEDSPAAEFAITDTGIGLNAEQVREFLATVGASSKGGELGQSRRTYIGQFGIGLLSCFLIADEIIVVSRSATGSQPVEWVGKSDGTYTMRPLTASVAIGTTVRLRPLPNMVGWTRVEQVIPLVKKYAEFIPLHIKVLTGQEPSLVSRAYPWARDFAAHRSAVLQGVSPMYGGLGVGRQFDAIEVSDVDLGLHGVVYIGATSGKSRGGTRNRVYVNDVLVDDADAELLPSWAFFAWAVINSTTLEPTASRESLMKRSALTHTQRKLRHVALKWLRNLADNDPGRFAEFVLDNELDLKSAAVRGDDAENLELAAVVLPMLTVETTSGRMRLIDVITANPNILYALSVKEFRTIASFNPDGRIIVNAGHTLDQETLLMLPQVIPGVTVTRAYPASEAATLTYPSTATAQEALTLERRGTQVLNASHCRVVVRRFPAADLPAVYINRGQVDSVSPGYDEAANLVMNWDNRVVRALNRTTDDLVFRRLMQLLYVQSRMAAQCDGPEDRTLLSEALDDIILLAAGIDGTEAVR